MRSILSATTALTIALVAPTFAHEHGSKSGLDKVTYNATDGDVNVSQFLGSRVYVSESDLAEMPSWNNWDGNTRDWTSIGEVGDIIMSREGTIQAIIVDVGGFLGIAEKPVAVSLDMLQFMSDGEDPNDFFVVFTADRDMLENAPEFQRADRDGLESTINLTDKPEHAIGMTREEVLEASGEKPSTIATSDGKYSYTGMGGISTAKSAQVYTGHDDFKPARVETLKAEALTGMRVYDAQNNWIGEIDRLRVADDGKIDEAVVDVGGFLGIGEKPVSLDFTSFKILQRQGGSDLRAYLNMTRDSLMALPEYDG